MVEPDGPVVRCAACFAEAARVLRPQGQLALSTLGPGTYAELRRAFAGIDRHRHTLDFSEPARLAAAAEAAGFTDLRVTRRSITLHYPDLKALLGAVKAIGANALGASRRSGMMGRRPGRALSAAMKPAQRRGSAGKLRCHPADGEKIAACSNSSLHTPMIRTRTLPMAAFSQPSPSAVPVPPHSKAPDITTITISPTTSRPSTACSRRYGTHLAARHAPRRLPAGWTDGGTGAGDQVRRCRQAAGQRCCAKGSLSCRQGASRRHSSMSTGIPPPDRGRIRRIDPQRGDCR